MRGLLTANSMKELSIKTSTPPTGNKPSTDKFTEDGKPVIHDGIRTWETGKLQLSGRRWWLRGCRLSLEMMPEATLKGCKWAGQRWWKKGSVGRPRLSLGSPS